MLKQASYKEKIEWIKPWLPQIIEKVKKDLKQEHLKIDKEFCRRYFLGRGINQVSIHEMADAYATDIAAGNVGLGEFIATRWLIKNTDLYDFFEKKLKEITPDFEQLEILDETLSFNLMLQATEQFGATRSYLFVILNSVVFPKKVLADLREKAVAESDLLKKQEEEQCLEKSLEAMQKRHQREIRALHEKHEKRLSGLQKKYFKDIQALKEQINKLQSSQNSG